MTRRIYILDTTLRDGAQTRGVEFSLADKHAIAEALNKLGVDYIEAGWPGSNPNDTAFFAAPPTLDHAKLIAFGMTHRAGISAENDPGLSALRETQTSLCIVGKSWDFQVETALRISLDENIRLISQSIRHLVATGQEVMFDAEHFFDGYRDNPDYSLRCIDTALESGARWVMLCDTNGGRIPTQIAEITTQVCQRFDGNRLGIHTHNDTGNALANSLAAVNAGVCQVQGTINGLGERCGNADILSVIGNLAFSTDYDIGVLRDRLTLLRPTAKLLDERLARESNPQAPYVGDSAFAHKAGLHASAIARDPRCYEHIPPESVGNVRHIVVSEQSGRANLVDQLSTLGYHDVSEDKLNTLLKRLKDNEASGFSFDGAMGSFALMVGDVFEDRPSFFNLRRYSITANRRLNDRGEFHSEIEIIVQVALPDGSEEHRVAMGNGPVNAMDKAMKAALSRYYPILDRVSLLDYKVRILPPKGSETGTAAITRVRIESALADEVGHITSTAITQGVSSNILDASYFAMRDTYRYVLWQLYREQPEAFARVDWDQ